MPSDFRSFDPSAARRRMVDEQLLRRGIRNPAVLAAMAAVPRHMFVPAALRARAYDDVALPIPGGQTISQPYIVALMTEALEPAPRERVLDVGTGSGYQTAVLAEIGSTVLTIERDPALAEDARRLLEEQGYGGIRYRTGDGTLGWPEEAPFDGILVAAAGPAVPIALERQLLAGGRLVMPIGNRTDQELYRFVREGDTLRREWLTSCRFVPLVGEEGWEEA